MKGWSTLVVALALTACEEPQVVEPVATEPVAERDEGARRDALTSEGDVDVIAVVPVEQEPATAAPAGVQEPAPIEVSAPGAQVADLQQSVGTIHGAVQALDYEDGRLTIDTGDGRMTLRARPLDIASLNPGDVVSVPYANYDGHLWVRPSDAGQDMSSFAVNGIVTGTVSAVDKTHGLFAIRGQTFRAHPEDVESLVPGQFVQVDYARIAGSDWAANVNASSGEPQREGLRKASRDRIR